jgi:uncharacterized protein (DUF305 family)
MKRKLLLTGFISTIIFSACKKDDGYNLQTHDSNKMMSLMHQMMNKMDTMPKTNDPEIDFSRMMKIHHQGAIDMANLELQEGKDDSLKRTAKKIMNEQQSEIQQFNSILATIVVDNSDPTFTMEQMENMKKGGKAADVQLITGDVDNDFATLMIVHHQGAIDNASAYLHHGNHAQLKTMANNIITAQIKEINELADWLKANKR